MPHVSIKCFPGRTEEQKRILSAQITKDITDIFHAGEGSVSVSIEEIAQEDWKEKVWKKEILEQEATMYKKPDYTCD